jgi:cell division protein FtsI/penicillin-binding protein 2
MTGQAISTGAAVRGRGRLLLLKIGLLAAFALIAGRLVHVQVLKASYYRDMARRQYEVRERLPAARGNIYDRNGRAVVSNAVGISFAADPQMMGEDAGEAAGRFARAFHQSRIAYLDKMMARGRRFVWLERRVKPQFSKTIRTEEIKGLVEIQEPLRLYHYEHLGGQVIGCTDIDNKGLSGLELHLDSYLRGNEGYVVFQKDGRGKPRPSVDYPRLDPTVGCSATLTLDIEYQTIAEEELARGIERTGAESGLVVMMDPATGEILAMAHVPSMDPANPAADGQDVMRNRVISDLFEPGSVFKLVTASAALERGIVKPGQKFDAEQGKYSVYLASGNLRNVITDTHPYGIITFQQAMELSSNIVMAKVSDRIGSEQLYTTARNFGFGTETGVDLPGEINGDLKRPNQWSGTTLNTMAYGYEVGVTPLQIASAYAAVANRGVLMKPFVVRKVVSAEGEVVMETQPQVVRRVISAATARILTEFFEGVVLRGTARAAAVPGLRVAGKTGTARKFLDGKYEVGRNTSSFVGYFPADEPRMVCLVMLDHPHIGGTTGGEASAPIFRQIAAKVYAMSGRFSRVPSAVMAAGDSRLVPDVVSLTTGVAREILENRGFAVALSGTGGVVRGQSPVAGAAAGRGAVITLVATEIRPALPGYSLVPDLRGMPLRRAINTLVAHQLDVGISGSGVVTSQQPVAGRQVKNGTRIAISCEPRSRVLLSLN